MTWFDQIVLLITGLVAIYLIIRFFQDYKGRNKPAYDIFYIVAFLVLLVAGLLLIFKGYDILPNPSVIVVTSLIPLGISIGLMKEFYPDEAKGYLIFAIVGFLAILLTRYLNAGRAFQIIALAFFHAIAGFVIFFVPIFVVKAKKAPGGFFLVTIGGTLIGIGGISLAFLKMGSPILSAEMILTILAPLLLLMTLAFAWGFMKKIVSVKKKKN